MTAVAAKTLKIPVLVVMSTLLIVLAISGQTPEVKPVLTISQKALRLKNENDTFRTVRIQCSEGSRANKSRTNSLKKLSIRHKREGASDEGEIMIEATGINRKAEVKGSASRSSEYKASGTLASGVTLVINKADCEDAGKYTCTMTYDIYDQRGSKRTVESSTHAYIEVEPYAINVSHSPDKPIVVGDLLVLKCTGVVGTLINDGLEKKSKLVWVYRNRESAIENKYLELDPDLQNKVVYGQSQKVRCSERQEVNLTLTVDENRDSLRDYYCMAARYRKGLPVELRPGDLETKISMPSSEKVALSLSLSGTSFAGFLGIGLALVTLMSGLVLGSVWFIRRSKKKARTAAIKRSKVSIPSRRGKSILSFLESRSRSMSELARSSSMMYGHGSMSRMATSSFMTGDPTESSSAESSVASEPSYHAAYH